MVEDYFCSLSDVKLETDSDSNFTDKERTADSDIATVARSTALISLVIQTISPPGFDSACQTYPCLYVLTKPRT